MGIGMIIFPTNSMPDSEPLSGGKAALPAIVPQLLFLTPGASSQGGLTPAPDVVTPSGPAGSPTPAATPTPVPTPTPEPTPTLSPENNPLLSEISDDLGALAEAYFSTILGDSFEEYKNLFYNAEYVNEELTKKRVEYIVQYHNIECYAKRGAGPVDYVLYVLNDVEIATIDTYAPSMEQLYVKYDEDGNPKIFIAGDSFSPEEAAYLDELNAMPDVKALIEDVTERMNEAVSSDAELRNFILRLQGNQ